MPEVTVRIPATGTLAVGASIENVLSGSAYEYLPYPARITVGVVFDGAGVVATISSGSDVLKEEGPCQIRTPAETLPIFPDDYGLSDDAAAGDRLKIRVRNTSAAVRTGMATVRIEPLA